MALPDRIGRSRQPSWLTDDAAPSGEVDLLFWSGGKDSFLALRRLERAGRRPVVLLTTFDADRRIIAHQEIGVAEAARQARHLALPLLGVPLHPGQRYSERIREACALVPRIRRFVFGDLHLEHIREWREAVLRPLARELGATLHFPLWGVSCEALIDDLEASGVACVVSAATEAARGAVRVGEPFDRRLMGRLPASVDPFGERGEFHTIVRPWEAVGGGGGQS